MRVPRARPPRISLRFMRATTYMMRKADRIMNHDSYDDSYIRGILNTVKTIAMVGA